MAFVKWDAFELGFTVLKTVRLTNNNLATEILIFHLANTVIYAEVFGLTMVNLFRVEKEDFLDAMEGAISTLHAWMKYIWIVYYQEDLLRFQQDACEFWDYRLFSEKAKTYAISLKTALEKLQLTLGTAIVCIITLYMSFPLFSAGRFYVLNLNVHIESHLLRYSILLSQCYAMMVSACAVYLYEIIFVTLCCQAAIQLQLLSEKIKFEEGNDPKAVLRAIVKHHQLILSVLARMKKQYSLVFLLQFVIMVASACSELLFISIGNTNNWVRLMKSFVYCSYLFVEYAIYCVSSEEICSKVSQFSQAVYFSKWYDMLKINAKDVAFLMMNSQKDVYFTIGDLMDVNMEAYVTVVRATFTFYAFINTMLLE